MLLRDLPWKLISNLLVLDYDDGWERLASELDYTISDLKCLRCFFNQGKSPTQEIILKWSYQEATIYDLWDVLLKIDRLAEVSAIEAFLKANHLPVKERPSNKIHSQRCSECTLPTCKGLQQLNLSNLPRPSERNLLQPKAKSISPPPPPPPTDEPPFHKPLNTDGQEHDSINMNKVTNPKDIDQVPKVDLKESEGPPEPSPLYKKIRSLVPSLELDCLYTYKEITTATNGFSEEYILGTGTFGTVYYGKIKRTDCAIKKLTKDYPEINEAMINLKFYTLEELVIQLKYRHPNVVSLFGYSLDSGETCFVFEYMENGSLEDCLGCKKNKPPLTWGERLKIALGAARGLQYLHTQNVPVIHGDVKSSNILIDKHKEAKIGDFGLAMFATNGTDTGILTHVSTNMSSKLFSTVAYMPPEFVRSSGKHYLAGDVYSFGVVLHEILTGEKAFDESRTTKRFLMEYIDSILAAEDDDFYNNEAINTKVPKGLNKILDPKAGPCFEDTYEPLYLLATKCIQSKKKDRPSMLAVFEELEKINILFMELKDETEIKSASLPYQLQQMYDERNQRSSSGASLESAEEETCLFTQDGTCSQQPVINDTQKENFNSNLNSSDNSESLSISDSESLRKKYQKKSLPPSMDSFFEKYQKLSGGTLNEDYCVYTLYDEDDNCKENEADNYKENEGDNCEENEDNGKEGVEDNSDEDYKNNCIEQ